ncbi:MAG: LysM peptidoglycan-binding domain-containing protein [Phycisphaerales bacterium]|nr:LysM peptidoglycan-binding domain-containing protein [Phycisphaerales bacterium]
MAGGGSDFVDGPTDLGPPRDIPYDDSPGVITDIGVGPADAGVGGGARTYVIKSGDQLWNVSEQHYQTGKHWQLIVAANPGLNPTSLPIGKTITIPPLPISTAGAGAVSGAGSADPLTSAGEKVYVVKSGDSGMWGVSESQYGHGKYFQAIAKRNPKVDSANLKVGQKLVIPSLEQAKILISGGTVTAGDTGGSGVTVVGAGGGAISGPTLGLGEKIYVVKDGDSGMWAISKSQYGDGKYFTAIASRNPKINPSKLKIGQKIVIPSLEQAQSHVSGGSSSGGGTSSPVPRPIPRPRPTPRPAPAPAPTGGSDEPDFS